MPLNFKKIKNISLMLIMALVVCLFTSLALADQSDDLKVNVSVEPNAVEKAGSTVKVNISIENTGDKEIRLSVFDPSGAKIKDIKGSNEEGDISLESKASISVNDEIKVSEKNINEGSIKYFLRIENSESEDLKYIEAKINSGAKSENGVSIERSFNSTVLTQGQELVVEYTITNNSDKDIKKIKILENSSISKKAQTLNVLKAGESHVFTFTKKMDKKNLTSSAKISYLLGKKRHIKNIERQNISYGETNLSASLYVSSTGVIIGEPVTLTIKLNNKGSIGYKDLKIQASNLEENYDNINIDPNSSAEYQFTTQVDADTSYQFIISGRDTTGKEVNLKTNKVDIKTMLESQKLEFDIIATPDKETVFGDNGKVKFTISVTNRSLSEAKNVTIYSRDVKVYSIPSIPSGRTKTFTRDFSISMSGNYGFILKTKNAIGEEKTFNSNETYIQLSSPTMVPVVITPSPLPALVTIAPKTWNDAPDSFEKTGKMLNTFTIIFSVLTIIFVVLIVVALIFRLLAKINSAKAVARITEVALERDYKKPHEENVDTKDTTEEVESWKKDNFSDILNDKLADDYVSPYADMTESTNSQESLEEDGISSADKTEEKNLNAFRRPSSRKKD